MASKPPANARKTETTSGKSRMPPLRRGRKTALQMALRKTPTLKTVSRGTPALGGERGDLKKTNNDFEEERKTEALGGERGDPRKTTDNFEEEQKTNNDFEEERKTKESEEDSKRSGKLRRARKRTA